MQWFNWENPVSWWWSFLVAATVANISFWFWTLSYLKSNNVSKNFSRPVLSPCNLVYLSGIYVFVCGFRSVFPRADVQRICLFDTWFSSVFLGRSLATVAELAFVAQWYIVIQFLGHEAKSNIASRVSRLFLPLIFVAECFSWYAVIRTHYLGNSVEESLWAITYTLIGICIVDLIRKTRGPLKSAGQIALVGCISYVLFMVTVDVPMYIGRLISDNESGKALLGFFEGIYDLNTRWVVTHSIADWRTEIPWQTLYFTSAVLVSIALCYLPLEKGRLQKYLRKTEPS